MFMEGLRCDRQLVSPPRCSKIPNGLLYISISVTCQDLRYWYYMQYLEGRKASPGCREGAVCHCVHSGSEHLVWISETELATKHASVETSLFRNDFRGASCCWTPASERNTVCVFFFLKDMYVLSACTTTV